MRCYAMCTGAIDMHARGPFYLDDKEHAYNAISGGKPFWVDNEIELLKIIEQHRQHLLKNVYPLEGHIVTIVLEDGRELGKINLAEFQHSGGMHG